MELTFRVLLAAVALFLQGHAAMLRATAATASSQQRQSMNMHLQQRQDMKNPIRPTVNLLESIRKDIEAEGAKAQELYDSFMCQCTKTEEELRQELSDARAKISQLTSSIAAEDAEEKRLISEIEEDKKSRGEAQDSVEDAKQQRLKAERAYDAKHADDLLNTKAIAQAVEALQKGMGGSFLQTSNAQVLKKLTETMDMADMDRDTVASFLSASSGQNYAPQSGEIVGILKQLGDQIAKDITADKLAEEAAKANFAAMQAAKESEISSLSEGIRAKMSRQAYLKGELAETREEIARLKAVIETNTKLLNDREGACDDKKQQHVESIKAINDEMVVIQTVIKLLTDEDNLATFKETLKPTSLLQVEAHDKEMKVQALAVLQRALKHDSRLNLIALVLKNRNSDIEYVLKKIDGMIRLLEQENEDDGKTLKSCSTDRTKAEGRLNEYSQKAKNFKAAMEEAKGQYDKENGELTKMIESIAAMKVEAKEASDTRAKNYEAYLAFRDQSMQAKQILEKALIQLTEFYKGADSDDDQEKAGTTAAQGQLSTLQQDELIGQYADSFMQIHARSQGQQKRAKSKEVLKHLSEFIDMLGKGIAKARRDDDAEQSEFEQNNKDRTAKLTTVNQLLLTKEQEVNTWNTAYLTASKDFEEQRQLASDQKEEIKAIDEKCSSLEQNFEDIQTARKDEIKALENTKLVLTWKPGIIEPAGFIQLSTRHRRIRR